MVQLIIKILQYANFFAFTLILQTGSFGVLEKR